MGEQQTQLPLYQCHKKVRAGKISAIHDPCEHGSQTLDVVIEPSKGKKKPVTVTVSMDAKWMAKHQPEVGGYLVIYEDGYNSFSPAAAFESGYKKL